MITKFDAFYGGHVEMEDFGFQGIPVDDRWLSDEHLSTALDIAKQFATVMDEKGLTPYGFRSTTFNAKAMGVFLTSQC